MGISGLLPFLKNASQPVHVRKFSGQTAAVDVYCWLHKGAFGCADKLVQGLPTDGYVTYVMKYVDILLYHDIKPILVFDGRNLPSKSNTEKKRRENRQKYRTMAKDFLRDGRVREARECFQRSIDITPEMAREVVKACQERNVDCIIAPYEADAQLAYLSLSGYADLVVSEDSDLTLFGCENILFKLDSQGNAMQYEKSKLNLCLGAKADAFNFEKFRYMCIMSGCDYMPSLHGIGLGKSFKFWSRVSNPNIRQVLPKIPAYLKMPQLKVTDEYVEGFVRANNTFLYQIVFDIKDKVQRPLNPYPLEEVGESFSYAGTAINDHETSFEVALGNLDMHNHQIVSSFTPGQQLKQEKVIPKYGRVSFLPSVWDPLYVKGVRKKNIEVGNIPTSENAFCFSSNKRKSKENDDHSSEKKKIKLINSLEDGDSENIESLKAESMEEDDLKDTYNAKKVEECSPKKIYVSKYFTSSKSHTNQPTFFKPRQSISSPEKENEKEKSWLNELDEEISVKDKFIYRSDSPKTEVKNLKFQIERLDCKILNSTPASRQPFKPVVLKQSQTEPESKVRNPFAVKNKKNSPDKKSESDDVEKISQENLVTPSKSLIDDGNDNDALGEHEKMVTVIKSPKSFAEKESSSTYFRSTSTTPIVKRKPKGASGLLKRPKKDEKQRSLLEMWNCN